MDDGRQFDTGDVVGELEVVGVQYQEEDGKRVNFTYLFKPVEEMKAYRKKVAEEEKAAEERRQADELAIKEQKEREEAEEAAHRN